MAAQREFDTVPAEFRRAVREVSELSPRAEIEIEQIPPPQRIAPHAFALSAEVVDGDQDIGTGRFILLHDPAGNEAWEGTFRCVTFARAEVDMTMAEDPLLTEVGWSWLLDGLAAHEADHVQASGSVTVVRSDSFGVISQNAGSAQLEVRASWTPIGPLGSHAQAWLELLAEVCGLPPEQPGVARLGRIRRPR